MNQTIKNLWTEALRSGEFRQGKHCLRDGNKYCCLGLLVDLHAKATGGEWDKDFNYVGREVFQYTGVTSVLPSSVMDWAEFPTPEGIITNDETLASLNDDGMSFEEIADKIDKHF